MSSLPSVAASGGLARYLEEIRRFPMLEPQQEYMLAKRWQEHEDAAAAQRGGCAAEQLCRVASRACRTSRTVSGGALLPAAAAAPPPPATRHCPAS